MTMQVWHQNRDLVIRYCKLLGVDSVEADIRTLDGYRAHDRYAEPKEHARSVTLSTSTGLRIVAYHLSQVRIILKKDPSSSQPIGRPRLDKRDDDFDDLYADAGMTKP